MTSDRLLVANCLAGREDAMRELVDRYRVDVFHLCRKLLRHAEDAEDVAQEVFLRVFRSLRTWDAARPLKPWILTIAVNRCRTCLAKRGRLPPPTEFTAEVPARQDSEPDSELTRALASGIEALRLDYREVFVLFHEEGRSYEEISEIVDRPVGTIKTWLHRARSQILTLLKARGFVPGEEVMSSGCEERP